MSDSGTVTHLDTNKFSSTIESFRKGILEYNDIKSGIEKTTNALFFNWQGEGKKQFEKDYVVIYQQLADIADILYELQDAIIEAQANYVLTDEEIAKAIDIGQG